MSKINDGGAAFPRTGNYDQDQSAEYDATTQDGMTLLEWYAGHALAGMLANDAGIGYEAAAHHAYLHADAMLAERAERAKPSEGR